MTDSSEYEQQSLIKDAARRFLDTHYTFENRRGIIAEEPGYSAGQWREMAELGWMLLPMSAEFGGLGGEMALVSALEKELGRSLCVSPFLPSAVVSTQIIQQTENEPIRSELLNGIGTGEIIVSPALYEPQSRYDLENIETTAIGTDDGIMLNGTKSAVLYGNAASEFLVLAKRGSDRTDARQLSLCLVSAQLAGVTLTHHRAHDGSRISDLHLNRVELSKDRVLLSGKDTMPAVNSAVCCANAMICAELVGAMEAALEMTLEHLQTRSQFGRKLSSFQALQHRAVDMFMRCQLAESMRREAACAVNSPDEQERVMIISAAKCEIARAALLNAEEAIQLHGAMGMMDEMPVGHSLKRIFTLGVLFGDADCHQTRYRTLRLQMQD